VAYKIVQSTKLGKKKTGGKSLSCYRAQFPKQFVGKLFEPSKLSVVVFPSVEEMSCQALVRVLLWLLCLKDVHAVLGRFLFSLILKCALPLIRAVLSRHCET